MAKTLTRTTILDSLEKIGEEIKVSGWVHTVRAHGKIAFLDLRDRTGFLQVGAFTSELAEQFAKLGQQDVVSITGTLKKREEKYINSALPTGTIELEAKELTVLSKSAEMPFDMATKDLHLELPTLLDYRALTLRHPQQQAIFKVQEQIVEEFRKAAKELGCMEVFVPTLAPSASEGGADVFKVDYYGRDAYLTQSPQLYKQILLGAFERVFMISHAYRAEPSVTTRHLSEVVQIDVELAFIEEFGELLDALEFVGTSIIKHTASVCKDVLTLYGVDEPLIPVNVSHFAKRKKSSLKELVEI